MLCLIIFLPSSKKSYQIQLQGEERQTLLSFPGFSINLRRMGKGNLINRSIAMVLLLVLACCIVAVTLSMLNLPEIPAEFDPRDSWENEGMNENGGKLGELGEMMIEMLPHDMAFTVFVPSDKAFEHILRLRANHSLIPEEWDNVYDTVTRLLGSSAVPRKIYADSIPDGKEVSFDSISGFGLQVSKDFDGALVVNKARSEMVDIRKGDVVVHVIDGILIDTEFENSVRPDDLGHERR